VAAYRYAAEFNLNRVLPSSRCFARQALTVSPKMIENMIEFMRRSIYAVE
jgi:hypothetical protein